MRATMSGHLRLAVFVLWLALVVFVSVLDPVFRWQLLLAVGVALVWGVAWVVAGYRNR